MTRLNHLLKWILVLGFIRVSLQPIHAATEELVSKSYLPYEILDVETTSDSLIIQGWALISYRQHFIDANDHAIRLEFLSLGESFQVSASLQPISQTAMMQYFGSPNCSSGSTWMPPETCNYLYENVGFRAVIPLNRFREDMIYQTNVIVDAYTANLSYKTPLYYPMSTDQVFQVGNREYRLISKLDDTNLKVSATTVIARKEPSKTSAAWYGGSTCSTTYSNQLFFLKDTVYQNVYQKVMVGTTSYYQVAANTNVCYLSRRRIVEGTALTPVWIASPYVLYSGSPLQIKVTKLNTPPVLYLTDIETYAGNSVDLSQNMRAIDVEDGDISNRIIIESNNFKPEIGDYQVIVSVMDSFGAKVTGTLQIRVLEDPNNPPLIDAKNATILQFTTFNPLDYAKASDVEDGDLTNRLRFTPSVDTNLPGTYEQCYEVSDSKNATDRKCIEIEVITYGKYLSRFRFISKNRLFYMEPVPELWQSRSSQLSELLANETEILVIELYLNPDP